MYGFSIYKNIDKDFTQKYHENNEEIYYKSLRIYYKKNPKFEEDKIFFENEKIIFGLDGVILNSKNFNWKKGNFYSEIEKKGISIVNELKGEFSGFIYFKETDTLNVFVNKTATKQVFYFQKENQFISTPNLEILLKVKTELGYFNYLNKSEVYYYLTFFSYFENKTFVQDVFKIEGGKYVSLGNKIELISYYDFNKIQIKNQNIKSIISDLNDTFITALKLEYDKEQEYEYSHLATLSGGLDSRMNVMLAHHLNYKLETFCFSQKDYLDEKISGKIAKDLKLKYDFYDLDSGDYLLNIDEKTDINYGMQFYAGSAHLLYTLNRIDKEHYGLLHTGQIGDGVLGGIISRNKTSNYFSKVESNLLINRIDFEKIDTSKYRDQEIFKLYQRVFNLTNYGSFVSEYSQLYLVSPFFDIHFLEVALSIEPDLKYNEKVYIQWINQSHPEISKYIWERTKMKPNHTFKTDLSKYTNYLYKKFYLLTNNEQKLSMNPVQYWYKINPLLKNYFETYFEKHIKLVETDRVLFNDLKYYFNEGSVYEKTTVLTLLSVINKYNIKV
jgi:asparagine synthase (glutamine-hydrolysing)